MEDNPRIKLLDLRPHKVHYIMNTGCFTACDHCSTYSAPGLKDKNALTEFERIHLTKIIGSAGVSQLTITGGEPMLHGALEEVVAETLRVRRRDPRDPSAQALLKHWRTKSTYMQVSLHTTGFQIPDKIKKVENMYLAGMAADHKEKGSNFIPSLSLDSSNKEFNDLFRWVKGNSYHDNVYKAMQMLAGRQINFTLKTAVMNANKDHIVDMPKFLDPFKEYCVHWLIQEVYPTGRAVENWDRLRLPKEGDPVEDGRKHDVLENIEKELETEYEDRFNTEYDRKNKDKRDYKPLTTEELKEGIRFSVVGKEFHDPYPYFFISPQGEVQTSDDTLGKEKSFGNIFDTSHLDKEREELREIGYTGSNPIVLYWRRILNHNKKEAGAIKNRSTMTDSDTRNIVYTEQQSQNP